MGRPVSPRVEQIMSKSRFCLSVLHNGKSHVSVAFVHYFSFAFEVTQKLDDNCPLENDQISNLPSPPKEECPRKRTLRDLEDGSYASAPTGEGGSGGIAELSNCFSAVVGGMLSDECPSSYIRPDAQM